MITLQEARNNLIEEDNRTKIEIELDSIDYAIKGASKTAQHVMVVVLFADEDGYIDELADVVRNKGFKVVQGKNMESPINTLWISWEKK